MAKNLAFYPIMRVSDLLDRSAIEYFPSYMKLGEGLNERQFGLAVKELLRNKGLDDIICRNSYILFNGKFRVFECISEDKVYYYPNKIYNDDDYSKYKKIAQIDLAIINKESIHIFEHKSGYNGLLDKASRQVTRYVILTSRIMPTKKVIGYVYLSRTGDLFRTSAVVCKNEKCYLILFEHSPIEFSKIKYLSKETIEKIVNSNREDAEKIIEKLYR